MSQHIDPTPKQTDLNALNSKTTIHMQTLNKIQSEVNFIPTNINANMYIAIAAYEASGGVGAPCMIGRLGDAIYIYMYQANGEPYTGSATVNIYFVDAQ